MSRVWWRDMTDSKKVGEIVKEIKRANPAANVSEAKVLSTIEFFSASDVGLGLRKKNKKYAEEVIEWIRAGERLLTCRTDTISPIYLFSNPETKLSVEIALADMRQHCESILKHKVGEHGNAGREQINAAWFAVELMERYGLPLTYSSETSVYRTVARLIFEAKAGQASESGGDIARACKSVALEYGVRLARGEDAFERELDEGTETNS
jgi:hypothetical protein